MRFARQREAEKRRAGRGEREEKRKRGGSSGGAANPAPIPRALKPWCLSRTQAGCPLLLSPRHPRQPMRLDREGERAQKAERAVFLAQIFMCAEESSCSQVAELTARLFCFRRTFSPGVCRLWLCGLTNCTSHFLKAYLLFPQIFSTFTASQKQMIQTTTYIFQPVTFPGLGTSGCEGHICLSLFCSLRLDTSCRTLPGMTTQRR